MNMRSTHRAYAAALFCAAVAVAVAAVLCVAQTAFADDSPTAMTQERIDAANDAYNNKAAKLTFLSMSDTEFGGNASTADEAQALAYQANNYLYQRIAAWAAKKNFDVQAVMDNGDVVGANVAVYTALVAGDSAKPTGWYRAIEQVFSENFGNDCYMLFSQGNHDIADLMGTTFDEKHKNDGKWFYPNESTNNISNFHAVINGYDFITLDYNGSTTFGYGGQRTGYQDFLKQTLADIKSRGDYDPKKPIFVQIHSGYQGTSLGGPFHANYDTAGSDLQTVLKDYPQALVGSAHTHFSVEPETSIYQKDFTFFENGSMNYIYQDVPSDFLGGGYFGGNQGTGEISEKTCNFISVLEDGSTVIRRFDVTHERWIGMPWVVDTTQGKAGFQYTDGKRSTTAPWWEDGAAATAANLTETSATLGFTQAVDDQLVNYYEISITDSAGNPASFKANQVPDFGNNAPKSFTGSFKAYSRWYLTPQTMGFDLTELKPATTYRVKVVAYDDFQNASAVPLEGTFRTAGTVTFPTLPEATLPEDIEDDLFFNMDFEGDLSDPIGGVTGTPTGTVGYADSYRADHGKAVQLGSGNGTYIDLGKPAQLDLGTDKNLTVNFWIKVNSHSGYSSILSNKNWANWWRSGINVAPQGGDTTKLEFTLGDGTGGSGGVYCTGDVDNYVGAWHMMSFTVDRESQTARTYFDGELKQEADIAGVGNMTSNLPLYLGIDASKQYGNIGFDMDDLQMWTRPLAEGDIAALYASTDLSKVREALADGIAYAQELKARMDVDAQNGRVYDETLTAALDAAVSEAQAATDATAQNAFSALKTAVENVENQPVRYQVKATAENGAATPEKDVVDAGDDAVFDLAPASGYQIDGMKVNVQTGQAYTVEGTKLVVEKIDGPVAVSVSFAEVTDNPGGDNPGGDNPGGDNPGGDNPGGDTPRGDGGTGGKTPPRGTLTPLAATGDEVPWTLGALAGVVALAALVAFGSFAKQTGRMDAEACGEDGETAPIAFADDDEAIVPMKPVSTTWTIGKKHLF